MPRIALRLLVLISAMLLSALSLALEATVDLTTMALNETLRLEITHHGRGDIDDIDLSGIENDFEILGRSAQNSLSIINGRTESRQSLSVKLAPLRKGKLQIPALSLKSETSRPITVFVTKAVPAPSALANQTVMIEAEVDRSEAYIGEQIIYTLRLLSAVQLNNPKIDSLQGKNATFKELDDQSYQRQIGGVNYQVVEKRYALFVHKPGPLTIPAVQFSALLAERNNRFAFSFGSDPFARGKPVKLASEPIELAIKPRPASFDSQYSADQWLPTSSLTLKQEWSDNTDNAVAGEPITRVVTLRGMGLASDMLPEIPDLSAPGVNSYAEKPEQIDQNWAGGLAGETKQSVAIIPLQSGRFRIPELRIPWWNTASNTLEVATLPGREINVIAPINTSTDQPNVAPPSITTAQTNDSANDDKQTISPEMSDSLTLWRGLALASFAGWIICAGLLVYLYRQFRQLKNNTNNSTHNSHGTTKPTAVRQSLKELKNACSDNNPAAARMALQRWYLCWTAQPGFDDNRSESLLAFAQRRSSELEQEIKTLEHRLYAEHGDDMPRWQGQALYSAVEKIRLPKSSSEPTLKPLYPTAASHH